MKTKYWVGGSICALASALCLAAAFSPQIWPVASRDASVTPAPASSPDASDSTPDAEQVYESPIDFSTLQAANPDIYAWLSIPGTEIEYPVLRKEGDDTFYLSHDSNGKSYAGGALFVESAYNSADLTDPVTIIYGHRMNDGSMFGGLQALYSDETTFDDYKEIILYLPEEEAHFTAFAAIPFENTHILYNYDFSRSRVFQAFLDQILSTRAIGAVVKDEVEISPDDQLLILSTCLNGNSDRRFLICAVRQDTV